jgi:hypothetical protein
VPVTLAGNIGEQLGWELLVTVVGKKGVHRPLSAATCGGHPHASTAHSTAAKPTRAAVCVPTYGVFQNRCQVSGLGRRLRVKVRGRWSAVDVDDIKSIVASVR